MMGIRHQGGKVRSITLGQVLVILFIVLVLGWLMFFFTSQIEKCETRGMDGIIINYQVVCMPKGTTP